MSGIANLTSSLDNSTGSRPTATWERQIVQLRLRFGYKVLLSVHLPLSVYKCPLTQVLETEGPVLLPAERPQRDQAGFLVISQRDTEQVRRLSRVSGYVRYVRLRYPRYFIDLNGTFDSYLAKFSSKTRSTLCRKVRKFSKMSGEAIDWREYRGPSEMTEFHALGRRVSAKTYQERLLDRGLPVDRSFLHDMYERAKSDSVRGYILFYRGEPVSYLYCPIEDGAVVYRFLGYDPVYTRHSVGTVLQMLVLERLFREARYRYFDFTEGRGHHKETFATDHRICADVMYLRPTIRNIALMGLDSTLNSLASAAVFILDQFHLTSRLKRRVRRASLA